MQGIHIIDGVDFAKYNPEIDWSGIYFNRYPEVANLKNHAGVYAFTLCGEPVYIGSSTNLFGRLQTHIAHIQSKMNNQNSKLKWKKYYYLNKHISQVQFQVLNIYRDITKEELEKYEYKYIHKYRPIFNINHKDALYQWDGTEQDIDNFINGIITIEDLKNKLTHQND